MTILDKIWSAYIAGLFEGEGCLHVGNYGKDNKLVRIRFVITMSDQEPLWEIWNEIGVGNLTGPYSKGPGKKDVYTLAINKFEHIQYLMVNIWPWLSPRRKNQYKEAATKFIHYKRTHVDRRRRIE